MIVITALHKRIAVLASSVVALGFLLSFLSGSSTRFLSALKPSSLHPTLLTPSSRPDPAQVSSSRPRSAGNATLGFQTIQVINLPHRHDRADALVLQSSISDLSLSITAGVDVSEIKVDKGMPPKSSPGSLKETEKACFRAYANLWRQMLHEKWSSALIMEADAAWDVNSRPISQCLSHAFNDLMDKYPLYSLTAQSSEHDPYNVAKWDLLSLGQCYENTRHNNESLINSDVDAPLGISYYGRSLVDERVVRHSGGTVCTTAYALSPRGARKLLVKFSVDMNIPFDLAIRSMIESDQLIAYSVQPSIIAQWVYRDGSGSEGSNSDISIPPVNVPVDHSQTWRDIHKSMNVWTLRPNHPDARSRNGALQALGRWAFGVGANK